MDKFDYDYDRALDSRIRFVEFDVDGVPWVVVALCKYNGLRYSETYGT